MKKQIILFLKYFISIESGTNKDIKNSKIERIYFNPEFYKAFVKAQYIKKDDKTFRGYPFKIDYEEGADYWGMDCSPLEDKVPEKNKEICEVLDSKKLEQEDLELKLRKPYIID